MQYVDENNKVILFVDNGEDHFEGKELFLLAKSLLSESNLNQSGSDENENQILTYTKVVDDLAMKAMTGRDAATDPATEAAFHFILQSFSVLVI